LFIYFDQKHKQGYDGTTLRLKRGNVMFRSQTHEGAAAVAEAIQFLRGSRAVGKVEFCFGLSEAARDIIEFMGGPDGNRKPNPTDMADLIDRRGHYEGWFVCLFFLQFWIFFLQTQQRDSFSSDCLYLRGRRAGQYFGFACL
jgi:hypothetical protein